MRLDRLVAERGGLSRKDARDAVKRGRVEVDGEPVTDPGRSVPEGGRVTLDGRVLDVPPELVAFHKPPGVQCTVGDPRGRTNLEDVAGDLLAMGLHPVGRLDADSEGLLLFSRDGALTQRLLHPRHGVRKVYVATVEGTPPDDLGARLAAGVSTALGEHVAELLGVEGQEVTLAVQEGKHRMVRRMLANLGLPVVRLLRVRFGDVELGDLPPGGHRYL
ncbi:MAG: rRNA pseudouridine synthase [Myxococcales bacterium]|nr:rRNA pseudouridine synthase [Myxococcales bacterium]